MAHELDEGSGRKGEEVGRSVGSSAIFDGPSLFARAWYAAKDSEELEGLSHCDAAACVSLKMLCSMLGEHSRLPLVPERLLFCWDGKERKSNKPRDPKPEGYDDDKQYFQELIKYLVRGSAQVVAKAEADDAVATAAFREVAEGERTVVVSGDKDLQQLQRSNIRYYCLNHRVEMSPDEICARWSIYHPREVSVALAVIGDPKDGIAGVHRWGRKRWEILRSRFPKEISLFDLIDGIATNLPDELAQQFLSSLEMTILQPDIPDVPRPAPYEIVSLETFDKVKGLRSARGDWAGLLGRS